MTTAGLAPCRFRQKPQGERKMALLDDADLSSSGRLSPTSLADLLSTKDPGWRVTFLQYHRDAPRRIVSAIIWFGIAAFASLILAFL